MEGTNGSWSQIVAKKAPGSDRSPGIWICPAELGLHWRFNPGNQGSNCIGPDGEGKAFDLKKWVHVAGVKKKNSLIMYMNGKEKGKFAAPDKHAQGEEKLYIGRTGYRSATFIIEDLFVYNRALKEAEVEKKGEDMVNLDRFIILLHRIKPIFRSFICPVTMLYFPVTAHKNDRKMGFILCYK